MIGLIAGEPIHVALGRGIIGVGVGEGRFGGEYTGGQTIDSVIAIIRPTSGYVRIPDGEIVRTLPTPGGGSLPGGRGLFDCFHKFAEYS